MNWAWPPGRPGAATTRRAVALATAAPWSQRTMCRHRSIPADIPAAVSTPSSSTNSMTPRERDAAAAVDAVMAELPEMAYLYEREPRLDSSDTERLLGVRAATPLDAVLKELMPSGA